MIARLAHSRSPGVGDLLAFGQAVDATCCGEEPEAEHDGRRCSEKRDELAGEHLPPVQQSVRLAIGWPSAFERLQCQSGPEQERDATCPEGAPNKEVHRRASHWRELHRVVGLEQAARQCGKCGGVGDSEGREKATEPERRFVLIRPSLVCQRVGSRDPGTFTLAIFDCGKLSLERSQTCRDIGERWVWIVRVLSELKCELKLLDLLLDDFLRSHKAQLRTVCGAVQ